MANLPWVPGLYQPNSTIAEMILRSGQDQANRTERMGQNIAGSIQDIGGALSQGLQQRKAQQNAAQAQGAISRGMAHPEAFESVLQGLPPEAQAQARKGFADAIEASSRVAERQQQMASGKIRNEQAKAELVQKNRDDIGTIAYRASQHLDGEDGGLGAISIAQEVMKAQGVQGVEQFDGPIQQWRSLYEQAKASGDPAALKAAADKIRPEAKASLDRILMGTSPEHMKNLMGEEPKLVPLGEHGLYNTVTKETIGGGQKAAKVGTFEDYVTQKFGPRPSPEQTIQARKEYGQADDRARITIDTTQQRPMTQTMEANVINRLSTQWKAAVAPTVELDRQVKLLDVGLNEARKGNMAQGAQTVLVTFQKILDPPSVVRESEYMRSASGLALMDRVKGAYEKLTKGGAGVPIGELEKFADLARQSAKAQAAGYSKAVQERIGKTADRYKIPRELVFEDFDFNFGTPSGPDGENGKQGDGLGIR